MLTVERAGITSSPVSWSDIKSTFGVGKRAPGIFTLDFSGSGPAVAINPDGTLNSLANPAPRGGVIWFFASGATGTSVFASIDDLRAGTGGIIEGTALNRIPVQIPDSARSGAVPLKIWTLFGDRNNYVSNEATIEVR